MPFDLSPAKTPGFRARLLSPASLKIRVFNISLTKTISPTFAFLCAAVLSAAVPPRQNSLFSAHSAPLRLCVKFSPSYSALAQLTIRCILCSYDVLSRLGMRIAPHCLFPLLDVAEGAFSGNKQIHGAKTNQGFPLKVLLFCVSVMRNPIVLEDHNG